MEYKKGMMFFDNSDWFILIEWDTIQNAWLVNGSMGVAFYLESYSLKYCRLATKAEYEYYGI